MRRTAVSHATVNVPSSLAATRLASACTAGIASQQSRTPPESARLSAIPRSLFSVSPLYLLHTCYLLLRRYAPPILDSCADALGACRTVAIGETDALPLHHPSHTPPALSVSVGISFLECCLQASSSDRPDRAHLGDLAGRCCARCCDGNRSLSSS